MKHRSLFTIHHWQILPHIHVHMFTHVNVYQHLHIYVWHALYICPEFIYRRVHVFILYANIHRGTNIKDFYLYKHPSFVPPSFCFLTSCSCHNWNTRIIKYKKVFVQICVELTLHFVVYKLLYVCILCVCVSCTHAWWELFVGFALGERRCSKCVTHKAFPCFPVWWCSAPPLHFPNVLWLTVTHTSRKKHF